MALLQLIDLSQFFFLKSVLFMDVVIIPLEVFEFVHMLFTFCRLGCLIFLLKGSGVQCME